MGYVHLIDRVTLLYLVSQEVIEVILEDLFDLSHDYFVMMLVFGRYLGDDVFIDYKMNLMLVLEIFYHLMTFI
jgi:hypothetical protein